MGITRKNLLDKLFARSQMRIEDALFDRLFNITGSPATYVRRFFADDIALREDLL
jgi:hypothetical protein